MKEREIQAKNSKGKIINIALEEFANQGYKAASTNAICKKGKISKGLLYHYFPSKEILCESVLEYSVNKFKEEVGVEIKAKDKKGIDYISEFFNIKFKFFKTNPLISKIFNRVILNSDTQMAQKFMRDVEDYNKKIIYEIIEVIDINPKFHKDKAFELINMLGEKLEEKHIKNVQINKEDGIEAFRKDHKIMIEMIFEGIEK